MKRRSGEEERKAVIGFESDQSKDDSFHIQDNL